MEDILNGLVELENKNRNVKTKLQCSIDYCNRVIVAVFTLLSINLKI